MGCEKLKEKVDCRVLKWLVLLERMSEERKRRFPRGGWTEWEKHAVRRYGSLYR